MNTFRQVIPHPFREWLAPARIGGFLRHRVTRTVLAWFLALGTAGVSLHYAWIAFADPGRADGTIGHATIDFGGQWLMGRMLVEGLGRHLYHRSYQRAVLHAAYPRAEQNPEQKELDAENLMTWFVGHDHPQDARTIASFLVPLAGAGPLQTLTATAGGLREWTGERLEPLRVPRVGGPLYPPVHAFLFAPLSAQRPLVAYRTNQVVSLVLAFVAGWGIRLLAQGRLWWPIATVGIIAYPGFSGSIALGQNAALTLAILIWGWVLIARERPILGGLVWGLLVFKPVWAAAFFLVPVLTGRWRVCVMMILTAGVLILATLPVVGWEVWRDWVQIGREASQTYTVDENWIFLSRDLLSIPRRWLLDFEADASIRNRLSATLLGWGLLLLALEATCRLAFLRRKQARATTGPVAAFLLLGAWLSCYHFMYYDVLLTALPVFLLFTEPRRYLEPRTVVILPVSRTPGDVPLPYYEPRLVREYPAALPPVRARPQHVWTLNSFLLTLLAFMAVVEYVYPLLSIDMAITAGFLEPWKHQLPQPFKLATHLKGPPWHTFCLMVLWLRCGWLWVRNKPTP